MRSSLSQLKSRGFVSEGQESDFINLSFSEQLLLLESKNACDRTIGARLLGIQGNINAIRPLCNALRSENKLYPKLEICSSLAGFGLHAVPYLVSMLGDVGNNQYKVVPEVKFKKKNYPLPRDLTARVLMRIGSVAMPHLQNVLLYGTEKQIIEAIDVIGYINFYTLNKIGLQSLIDCFERFKHNDIIIWKIVRAMSAFPLSEGFLRQLDASINHSGIKQEISRSLEIITSNKTSWD